MGNKKYGIRLIQRERKLYHRFFNSRQELNRVLHCFGGKNMDYYSRWVFTGLMTGIVGLYILLRRLNEWLYVGSLGNLKFTLPPGHLGWPLIGNMWSLFRAFKYGDPDSFISSFTSRYGRAPMYRVLLFGKPSIIVTTAETCRKVLTDERFIPGWPKSVSDILGKKGLHRASEQERKRLRQMMQSPIAGKEALSSFFDYIKVVAETSFQEWANIDQPIEFMTEIKETVFKAFMKVFLSTDQIDKQSLHHMEREFTLLIGGGISMPINLPGFAYHKALKARKNLVKIFQEIVYKRRAKPWSEGSNTKKDLLGLLMEASDDSGDKLSDEEIMDLIIIFLHAGFESTSLGVIWTIIFLEENSHILKKAKEEQEDIVKKRTYSETGLSFSEIKQMKYLDKVIDETLRLASLGFAVYREAKIDVSLNGYSIPKGWKVIAWIRNVHFDPENYENPKDFNPLRWNDDQVKGAFLPFGAGSRFCPGADLAKLQISIFLHYFLLNYRLQRINPKSKVQYLPFPKPADNCLARIKKLSPSN